MVAKGRRVKLHLQHYQTPFVTDFSKYSALVGGFGSGKTFSLNNKVLALIKKRRDERTRAIIGYYAPTNSDLRDNNINPLTQYFDELNLKYDLNKSTKIMTIPAFGAKIMFKSMHLPETIKGYEITDAIIDEFDVMSYAKQNIAWNKIIARVRGAKNGTISIGTTPEGFRKTHELFVTKKIGNLYQVPTRMNKYLPEDYIEALASQYDGELLNQYMNGQFVNLNGSTAYYGFTRINNEIDQIENIDSANEILVGMDFNVDPMCAVLAVDGTDEKGNKRIYIYDEIYMKNANTYKMRDYLKDRYPNKQIVVYPDMTGGNRKTSAKYTDLEILRKGGFIIRGNINKYVRDSLNIVNNALQKRFVLITNNCKILIKDYEQVVRNEYGDIEKEKDKDLTHISDASRYLIDRMFKGFPKTRTGRR